MSKKKEVEEKELVKPVGFKLKPSTIELLKKLSIKSLRSQSKTLEFLITEASKREGIL